MGFLYSETRRKETKIAEWKDVQIMIIVEDLVKKDTMKGGKSLLMTTP